ncbi:MAG: phosphoribosylaminoimidazolesuccinocarboxamide synthase [Candidatus Coatesbacteria bacterium]|nr:phosphoribosylaminoimidazolesuccinocarboxamide synthase [Candidatus Coatesbacteria bacterium]
MNSEQILNGLRSVADLEHIKSGKVREMFHFTDKVMVMVATDRISAFDLVLPNDIPSKGRMLTGISKFWFQETQEVCPNHFISTRPQDFMDLEEEILEILDGRTMLIERMDPIPFECIVRGYLCGSAFREYQKSGTVNGVKLDEGLQFGDKIEPPIFTPTTKAEVGHDEPVGFEAMQAAIGEADAETVKSMSLELYDFGRRACRQAGLVLVDTKFEFGYNRRKDVCVMDEMLTPDSSRFWLNSDYTDGNRGVPYDKEFVREYLVKSGWDKEPPAPALPEEIVAELSRRYALVHDRISELKL